MSSLTDVSAGGNRLAGAGALGALPACLTKLVLRENNLGEVPLAVLGGLPALQVRVGTWTWCGCCRVFRARAAWVPLVPCRNNPSDEGAVCRPSFTGLLPQMPGLFEVSCRGCGRIRTMKGRIVSMSQGRAPTPT